MTLWFMMGCAASVCHSPAGSPPFPELGWSPLINRVGVEDGHSYEQKHDGNGRKQHDQNRPHPVIMGTGPGPVANEPAHEEEEQSGM